MKRLVFGTFLRAMRLRFAYVESKNFFIRVSDHGENFLVEVRPNDVKQLNGGKSKTYRIIQDPDSMIAKSPVLSSIKNVRTPIDLVLDEFGRIAR